MDFHPFSMPSILYEDNHLLAVVKPAGMLSQGDETGDLSLLDLCRAYLKEKYQKPGNVFLGLLHRLDRPASGILLFARTSKAASRLSASLRERRVQKIYRAVVEGHPSAEEGELVHLLQVRGNRIEALPAVENSIEVPHSKLAILRYHLLRATERWAELEIELKTGYKHQIRVQLAAIGCPIVGDFRYGKASKHRAPSSPKLLEGRAIALHAWKMAFPHPTRREIIALEAPLPDYWPRLL